MKTNLKTLIFISILPVMTLASCEKGKQEPTLRVTNLSTALQYMNKYENYTIEYWGVEKIAHSFVFTENSIGIICEEKEETETQYIKDKGGIYSISYEEGELIASEYYKDIDDLYNCPLQYTLKDKATEYVNSITEDVSISVTDKTYKLALLSTLGYSQTEIMDISYIGAFYDNNQVKFTIGYNKTETIYIAKDFGKTTNPIVDGWLKNGGKAFVPNSTQNKMRDLFEANNYTQLVYSFGEDGGGFVMSYLFNPNYFGGKYLSSNVITGAIAIDATVNINEGTDKEPQYTKLYGCYNYQVDYTDKVNYPYGNPTIFTYAPLYSKPDIVSYYHYPSQMKLLSNMQYLKKWNEEAIPNKQYAPEGDESYVVTNQEMINDFDRNFSISQSFEGAKGLAIGIDITYGETDSDYLVNFIYYFSLGGFKYIMPIPFGNFGTSSIPILDYVLSTFND